MANRFVAPRRYMGVKMDPDALDRVDALARERGSTRSDVIREAVDALLRREHAA